MLTKFTENTSGNHIAFWQIGFQEIQTLHQSLHTIMQDKILLLILMQVP